MAAPRSSVAGMGYVGIPALIFIELNNYGRGTQTYEEKRIILHKIYAYLRGYLYETYNNDKKAEEFTRDIDPLLKKVSQLIDLAREQYQSTFETIATCNPDEKIFQATMDKIAEKLIEIIAVSKVIDKQKPGDEEMLF